MNVDRLVDEYLKQKEFIGRAQKRNDELKEMLVAEIDNNGEVDPDKGHKYVQTDNWELVRQRRVSKTFDYDAAEKWAESIGKKEEFCITETRTYFSQDKLLAWVFEHPEYEEVYQSFCGENVTWAFTPPKLKKDIEY